jgi:hypothetical protein
MARYNTVSQAGAISSTATINTPSQGLYTEFTGTAPYNVDLPSPVTYQGSSQTFYNSTAGVVTLRTTTNGGYLQGPGQSGTATTYAMPAGSTATVFSDGANFQITSVNGAAVNAANLTASGTVSLSPAGTTVTISPTGSAGQVIISSPTANASKGTIDNFNIGSTSQGSGAFTSLSANVASNNALAVTGGIASAYNTSTAALLVTGGVGISGATYTNGLISAAGNISSTVTSGTNTFASTAQGSSAATGNAVQIAGGLGVAGTLYTVGLVETSSIAFKENVNPIVGALEAILGLTGVTYDRKDIKKHEAGLIAEDVFKHAPELVAVDENGKPYGIHYTKISAYLIECVKTLQAEINELKGKK